MLKEWHKEKSENNLWHNGMVHAAYDLSSATVSKENGPALYIEE